MLWLLVLRTASCIAVSYNIPKYNYAMVGFKGNANDEVDHILSALESTGAPAVIYLDPHKPKFDKQLISTIEERGSAVGMYVTRCLRDAGKEDTDENGVATFDCDKILAAKAAFIKKSGMIPRLVAFGDCDRIDKQAPDGPKFLAFLQKHKLIHHPASISEPKSMKQLYKTISALDARAGSVFLMLKEPRSPTAIANIINHVRRRHYNIVHPSWYFGIHRNPAPGPNHPTKTAGPFSNTLENHGKLASSKLIPDSLAPTQQAASSKETNSARDSVTFAGTLIMGLAALCYYQAI